jgi:hypothetical protein
VNAFTAPDAPAYQEIPMPNIPIDDVIGFGAQTRAYLNTYQAALVAKTFDPTAVIAAILADEADLATANQTQESLKTQRKNQTSVVDAKKNDLFTKTSTTLDAAVGFMGKTTNEGIEGLRLRSTLRGRQIDDVIGFVQQVRAYLNKYKTTLIAKGYDPTAVIAEINNDAAALATENALQDSLTTQLKNHTVIVETKRDALYNKVSTTLDAATGLLGKTTPEGKEGLAIRATLRGLPTPTPPPPPPTPPPTPPDP